MVENIQRSIAVVGLGFVGLPLSQLFLKNGFTVHGIDVDKDRLLTISQGACDNPDIDNNYMKECFENKRLFL
jgi:UDP-N-acetyl-D-glucosamine dehydrogenase